MTTKHPQVGPKTAFGRFMVYKFVPQYANNVQGLVYMGAACLIIIVGLRGIGKVAASIAIVPKFLLGLDGKVAPMWVMAALFLEFSLLMVLAIVTFFTPEDQGGFGEPAKSSTPLAEEIERIKSEMAALKSIAKEDIDTFNEYVEALNHVNRRLAQAKTDFLKSLSDLKQLFK